MMNDLEEDSNKQISRVRKSIEDLDKKFSNMNENSARKWKL
jgi:hypothetical protein